MPKVSIIVTTYNRQQLLKETILSILNQRFTDFELLIIDNYSDYNFMEFIMGFNDKRIIGYQNRNNGIIAINRNFGIKHSKGEYIALCDDDDLWEPTKLSEQVRVMLADPSIALSCTNMSLLNYESKKNISRKIISKCLNVTISSNIIPAKYTLIFYSFIANSSVLFKREIINSVGFINENINLRSIEDFDFWFRISQNYKVYYLNKKLIRYRIHEMQASNAERNTTIKRTLDVISSKNIDLNRMQKFLLRISIAINN